MRSVVMEARDGLEAEYECTSLAGPHCRTHGPTGNLFTEPEVQSEDDGSLLIQLDDATIGKDGKIDLAKVMEMFGGGVMQKAKEAAAATNEARAARAAAAANGDAAAANAAVEEAQAVAAKIGIGRANGAFEMHSPLAAGRRLKPDAVVGRGGEGLASVPSRDDRKVEFINARDATSALYWLDFDGNEAHYVDLPPGMTTMMSTFGSHVWVSRDMATNAAVASYTVTARKPGDPPVQHFIVTDVDFGEAMAAAAAAFMAQHGEAAEAEAEAKAAGDTRRSPEDTRRSPEDTRRPPEDTRRSPEDTRRPPEDTRRSPEDTRRENAEDSVKSEVDAAERERLSDDAKARGTPHSKIDSHEIERRRRRHEAVRAAAAARQKKLSEEDPERLRSMSERIENAKLEAAALGRQVAAAKEEARKKREELERDDTEL